MSSERVERVEGFAGQVQRLLCCDFMKQVASIVLLVAFTVPVAAQRRVDLLVDAEGVRRTGGNEFIHFEPLTTRFDPSFQTGGGIGGGVNWFFSDRVSLELKVAALESRLMVRAFGLDNVANISLGHAYIYPITAIAQWHMTEHGAIRPYVGAGVAHIILHNVNHRGGLIGGIDFKDPTGVVVDGGLEWRVSPKWSFTGDARYVPIETNSAATFVGTGSSIRMHVKPLIASFGVAYHY